MAFKIPEDVKTGEKCPECESDLWRSFTWKKGQLVRVIKCYYCRTEKNDE